ncbi:hypothetical protein KAFR_0F00670 [Kazachstania africana CBS 2517]|uniref:diacylglycerol cholinephosphotransferase n=1 Tax=Kazachstania africana (strain ATCC 22294 / BCRC 22015 / CBS 2517 / CECT 1963 / NBRC 1671 / NRRL Y-8276) TaxID=1071382 RepID=H2AWB4_KAZAF|nr:hypothetical protein KAFR_0F00670 [Kazachstania africana CBS 2517]CCF58664.1 hypothetical protein KAFR_0F00670 [Kazachstania africana CBS 2517]
MGFFLPEGSVDNLKYYKYQSEDRSVISKYFLKPYWSRFADIFPKWMAPNLITLSGLGFIIFNLLIALKLDPTLTKETPRWTYFSYALGLFMYQTFDGCDGVHARRIGQSGPLGELFDHSIDSINTTLTLFIFGSVISSGYTFKLLISQFALLCNFYFSTWEEYHTHVLFLSEVSGPVEGILGVCFAFIITGVFGPELVWHTKVFEFPYKEGFITLDISDVVICLCIVGLLFNVLSARRNVIDHYKQNKIVLTANSQIKEAYKGVVPFFCYFLSVFIVSFINPAFISFPFVLSVGLSIAFVVGRIIVNHLTLQPFPMYNAPLFIPTIQLIVHKLTVVCFDFDATETTKSLVWLGFGLTFGLHAFFMNEIIYEFTTYLDVYALSIKRPKFV